MVKLQAIFHNTRLSWLFVALLFLVGNLRVLGPPSVSAIECEDVIFVFARGSGEQLHDTNVTAWEKAINASIKEMNFSYKFYELGTESVAGFQYPAVPVSGSFWGLINLAGAAISGGSAFEFGYSIEQGVGELNAYVEQISASCPHTKFVLGGYSQGAMIVSRAVSTVLDSEKIIYAATFGDPKLYLPEGARPNSIFRLPEACYGRNLSNYRIDVPNCYSYEGVLGSLRPYQPEALIDRLGTWCAQNDIMCSAGMSIDDHLSYASGGYYLDAATRIARALKEFFPQEENITSERPIQQVAFLFDVTASMETKIERYMSEAKRLAQNVIDGGGQIALYFYGDLRNAELEQKCDFSCTLEEFESAITSADPSGGGDYPESALSAMKNTMRGLKWQNGALKSMMVLTDAPYFSPDFDETTEDDVISMSLSIDPVNIYVLTESGSMQYYQDLTEATGGSVFNIWNDESLRLSTDTLLSRPVASLALSSYKGLIGDEFLFDASASYDQYGSELSFAWDLDGDGIFEKDGGSVIKQVFTQAFSGFVQVKVTNSSGSFSTMSAEVTVLEQASALPRITEISTHTSLANGTSEIKVTAEAERILLILDELPIGFVKLPSSGTALIQLEDVTAGMVATLVPYANNTRGWSDQVTFGVVVELPDEPAYPSEELNLQDNAPSIESPEDPIQIPKVPDAGVRNSISISYHI